MQTFVSHSTQYRIIDVPDHPSSILVTVADLAYNRGQITIQTGIFTWSKFWNDLTATVADTFLNSENSDLIKTMRSRPRLDPEDAEVLDKILTIVKAVMKNPVDLTLTT